MLSGPTRLPLFLSGPLIFCFLMYCSLNSLPRCILSSLAVTQAKHLTLTADWVNLFINGTASYRIKAWKLSESAGLHCKTQPANFATDKMGASELSDRGLTLMNWLTGTESNTRDWQKAGRFGLHSLFHWAEKHSHLETTGMLVSYFIEKEETWNSVKCENKCGKTKPQ